MMKKILIIDDEVGVCQLLQSFLKKDYEVMTATGGQGAIEIFVRENPDAVISDFNLGEPPYGDELLRIMKEKVPSITVVMMSGEREIGTKLLLEGADAFFEKPVDFSRLQKFLDQRFQPGTDKIHSIKTSVQ